MRAKHFPPRNPQQATTLSARATFMAIRSATHVKANCPAETHSHTNTDTDTDKDTHTHTHGHGSINNSIKTTRNAAMYAAMQEEKESKRGACEKRGA